MTTNLRKFTLHGPKISHHSHDGCHRVSTIAVICTKTAFMLLVNLTVFYSFPFFASRDRINVVRTNLCQVRSFGDKLVATMHPEPRSKWAKIGLFLDMICFCEWFLLGMNAWMNVFSPFYTFPVPWHMNERKMRKQERSNCGTREMWNSFKYKV